MVRICALIVLLCFPGLLRADVAGAIRVIDGDTISIAETRIRLHGIDAPELDQTCRAPAHTAFRCGAWVRDRFRESFEGRRAECRRIDTDRYGRMVAKCFAGHVDLSQWLVQQGLAFAYRRYSLDYDLDEKTAFAALRGLHAFDVQGPQAFRQAKAQSRATQPETSGCTIKGNISGHGRIYHLPGQKFYDGTSIWTDKGERWFCSEDEARAAGWRRARR